MAKQKVRDALLSWQICLQILWKYFHNLFSVTKMWQTGWYLQYQIPFSNSLDKVSLHRQNQEIFFWNYNAYNNKKKIKLHRNFPEILNFCYIECNTMIVVVWGMHLTCGNRLNFIMFMDLHEEVGTIPERRQGWALSYSLIP